MAFYIRICDYERKIDIKSYKLPFMMFVTQKYMLETLDDCYDLNVLSTKISTINILEKEFLKQPLRSGCYKGSNLIIVIMTDNKFNNISLGKLITQLKSQYSADFGQQELNQFINDNQEVHPDKLDQVNNTLGEVIQVMHQNIDLVLARGENIDSLLDKSEHLSASSIDFNDGAKRLNRRCGNCVLL